MSLFEESRWLQSLQSYQKALTYLDQAVKTAEEKGPEELNDLEKQGFIKCFEMTFELAWKTLKRYLEEQGYTIGGPRDAILQAFKDNLIKDGEVWIKMMESRNRTSHVYDGDLADNIIVEILNSYFEHLNDLDRVLTGIKNG